MRIHFVCSGNTNRSRMAEAYLKSKKIPGVSASSSGITAIPGSDDGAVSKYAEKVLGDAHILEYASSERIRTTPELLNNADLVIFMAQKHFDYVKNELRMVPKKYEIWHVGDIPPDFWWWLIPIRKKKLVDDRDIFEAIKIHADELVRALSKKNNPGVRG